MIKAILFDLGGVFFYDVWLETFFNSQKSLVTEYRLDPKKLREVGNVLWRKFAYEISNGSKSWQEEEREYWEEFIAAFKNDFPKGALPSVQDLIDLSLCYMNPLNKRGTQELLNDLKSKGYKLGILSNNTTFYFERSMKSSGLEGYFEKDKLFMSYGGFVKPRITVENIQKIKEAFVAEESEIIFFDNQENNIEALEALGIKSILVPADFEKINDFIKENLAECSIEG